MDCIGRERSVEERPLSSVGQSVVSFSVLLFLKVVDKFHVAKSFMKVAYRCSFIIHWGWLMHYTITLNFNLLLIYFIAI